MGNLRTFDLDALVLAPAVILVHDLAVSAKDSSRLLSGAVEVVAKKLVTPSAADIRTSSADLRGLRSCNQPIVAVAVNIDQPWQDSLVAVIHVSFLSVIGFDSRDLSVVKNKLSRERIVRSARRECFVISS